MRLAGLAADPNADYCVRRGATQTRIVLEWSLAGEAVGRSPVQQERVT